MTGAITDIEERHPAHSSPSHHATRHVHQFGSGVSTPILAIERRFDIVEDFDGLTYRVAPIDPSRKRIDALCSQLVDFPKAVEFQS